MYSFNNIFFCIIIKLFLFFFTSAAQDIISGKVTDALTNEPVAFANVIYKNTTVGTITDFNGDYELRKAGYDTLFVSFLGYEPKIIALTDTTVIVNVQLFPSVFSLEEVVVRPGENPAHNLLRQVWKNNEKNNIERLRAYQYENYSRSTVFFRKFNYKDSVSNSRLFQKEFEEHSVSTGDEGFPALPGYISESVSDVYFLRFPKREFINIKSVNSKGLAFDNTDFVSQLTSHQENFNFLNNSVSIIDKSFISPLSRYGLLYYKYYLIDSMYVDNNYCYEIHVVPRREEDPVFKGTIWITDTTYSLKRISVEVGKKTDLNFIRRIKIQQDYCLVDSAWFPVKTRFMADAVNLFITNYSEKNNIIVNKPQKLSFYDKELKMDFEAKDHDQNFWENYRAGSFEHIDSAASVKLNDLNRVKKIKITSGLIEASIKGYYNFGSFEGGPYLLMYGHNSVEGNRVRLGGRTNNNLSKNWIFEGYLAYGFTDAKFKGALQAERFLIKKYWTKAGILFRNDIEKVGATDEFYSKNAFLTFASTFGGTDKLSWSETYRTWVESDFFNDFNAKIVLTHKTFDPVSPDFHFAYFTDNSRSIIKEDYKFSEVSVSLFYQPQVTYILDGLKRFPVNFNKLPSFTLEYFYGIKDLFDGDFNYRKFSAKIHHNFTMGGLGLMVYEVGFSKVFDPLPYPMLTILPGNESFFRSNRTFNLMGYGEFVADEAIEFFTSYHMDGLILNKIPLIKKLNWRTVVTGHAAFGSFDEANGFYNPVNNPEGLLPVTDMNGNLITSFHSLTYSRPYAELSYGIENIFRFFRIDLIQRLSHLDNPDAKQFGIKISGVFRF